jgi:hypothetical protein
MSPAGEPSIVVVAIPALVMVAIGAGILFGARALVGLQIRMMEWQLEWMKGGAGLLMMRLFGGFFILCGLALFVLIATLGSK